MKQRRARSKKPPLALSGMSLDLWQSDPDLIRWAQTEPKFRLALTVLINERSRSLDHDTRTSTENLRLGSVIGYELAVGVIQSLAHGNPPTPLPEGAPTYGVDPSNPMIAQDIVHD